MKKLIAAAAFATVLASPALAQSYDPDFGSGNIAPPLYAQAPRSASHAHARANYNSLAAFAQVRPGTVMAGPRTGQARPGSAMVGPGIVRWDGAIARDPDPNIQFQLNREAEEGEW